MKKIRKKIKINLWAGKAKNVPPIGPILGQFGVNINAFIKEYNTKSLDFIQLYDGDVVIPALITIYDDKTFIFDLKTPPTSFFIKKYGIVINNLKKKVEKTINISNIEKIANIKLPELNTSSILSSVKIISGTAVNMGYTINN